MSAKKPVAAVICPSWANLPPLSLAYIKGAISSRPCRAIDLSIELVKTLDSTWRSHFSTPIPDIPHYMFTNPNFHQMELHIGNFLATYHDFVDHSVRLLLEYDAVLATVFQTNVVATFAFTKSLRMSGYSGIIVFGGPSMNMDERVFAEYALRLGYCDVVGLGTAEQNIEQILLAAVDRQRPLDEVPNIMYKVPLKNIIVQTKAESTTWTRTIPPDYSDFNLDDYFTDQRDSHALYAVTGCAGKCEFCTINEFYQKLTIKPVPMIIEEIQALVSKHPERKFFLSDSMFLGSAANAHKLFDFAIDNNISLGIQIRMLPYWNDDELVAKAKECTYMLQVGYESASANVRQAMGKMVDPVLDTAIWNRFLNYQLPLYVNIIVGYPNESEQNFQETALFLKRFLQNPNVVGVGTNSFFIPNDFPVEKYNISYDNSGHWYSKASTIADRYRRVQELMQISISSGKSAHYVYYDSTVEGIPLSTNQGEMDIISARVSHIKRLMDTPNSEIAEIARHLNDICKSQYVDNNSKLKLISTVKHFFANQP